MAVAACLLGAAIPVALADSGTWSTQPAQLSSNTSGESGAGQAFALSDNGDISAAWINQTISGTTTAQQLDAAVDSGTGFGPAQAVGPSDPLTTTGNAVHNVPQVAEDGQGDAVAVWTASGRLTWAEQSQPATGFTEAPNAIDGGAPSTDTVADSDAHVAMDSSGDAIAVWAQEDITAGTWSVMYSVLPAGADQTFKPPVTLAGGLPNDPAPQVSVNQQAGDATVAYLDGPSIYAFEDYLGTLAQDSELPDPATAIYTAGDTETLTQLAIAVDARGDTAFAWVDNGEVWSAVLEYQEASFTANGADYAPDYILSGSDESDPEVAIYPSNMDDTETAVAFYDGDTGKVVVAARSSVAFDTQGNGWESQTIPTYSQPASEQQPQLSIASDGVATMVWEGQSSETTRAIYAMSSDDDGSFAASSPTLLENSVSTSQCDGISCVSVAANTPGDLVAGWTQYDANSNAQIRAQCLQANSTTGYTGTDTIVTPEPSTLNASGCIGSGTTTSTTTTSTTTTGTATTSTQTTTAAAQTAPSTTTAATAPPATGTTAATTTPTIFSPTTSGTVLVKLTGSNRFVAVNPNIPIPNGSVIDATRGTVQLTFSLPDGQTETASFWGGEFTVTISASGAVRLKLAGGSFKSCPKPSKHTDHAASVAKSGKPSKKKPGSTIRSLWSKAKGNFTTAGQNGSAAVLGTTWLIRDQCDGTYFYVKSTSDDPHGAILVTVLHPHRHRVRLRRGHHLLAPAAGY